MRELVHGTVGVDGRGFAEQNHRDGAKRNRDDRLSELLKNGHLDYATLRLDEFAPQTSVLHSPDSSFS